MDGWLDNTGGASGFRVGCDTLHLHDEVCFPTCCRRFEITKNLNSLSSSPDGALHPEKPATQDPENQAKQNPMVPETKGLPFLLLHGSFSGRQQTSLAAARPVILADAYGVIPAKAGIQPFL